MAVQAKIPNLSGILQGNKYRLTQTGLSHRF